MKPTIPKKFWRQLHDICQCTHSRIGHSTDGKGRCRICKECKKFNLLRSSSLSELEKEEQ